MSIIVGDLHGNIELYHKIKKKFSGEDIILLGDLLDSYIYPIEQQAELVHLVLSDIKSGKVVCLFGNHELSYLMPNKMRCSGYNPDTDRLITHLKGDMLENFRPFLIEYKFLLTHAGLSKKFFDCMPCNHENPDLVEICKLLHQSWKNKHDILNIGYSRGGRSPYAGIFWCDWNADFKPIHGIKQICGHTPAPEIRRIGDNYCIDCLPSTSHRVPMGLSVNGNKVEKVRLDE
jgi:predicted phosphodiesterase